MQRLGTRSARSAQVAALETRRAKDYRVRPEELRDEWRERAARLGLRPGTSLHRALRSAACARVTPSRSSEVFAQLAGPDGLTATRASFTRRDVVRALCERLPVGSPPREIEASSRSLPGQRARRAAARPAARGRADHDRRAGASRRGRSAATRRPSCCCSRAGSSTARSRRAAHRTRPGRPSPRRARARRGRVPQRRAAAARPPPHARRATASRWSSARPARARRRRWRPRDAAWAEAGVPVLGCAVSRRAAQELEIGQRDPVDVGRGAAGTASIGPRRGCPTARCSSSTRPACSARATQPGCSATSTTPAASSCWSATPHQLPSIAAGGLLAGLATRLEPIELTENRRQHHAWERKALERLRDGHGRAGARRLRRPRPHHPRARPPRGVSSGSSPIGRRPATPTAP